MSSWYVYIVRCADSSLYIGITPNIEKRIALHNSGKGAKYTSGRGPVELLYNETHHDRSTATKREIELKKLSRKEKETLIAEAVATQQVGLTE